MNKEQNKVYTYPDHKCTSNVVYGNTSTYNVDTCMICDKIIKFRWKSFWKRITEIL